MARNSLKNVMRLIESTKAELPVEQEFLQDLKRSIELTANKDARKPSQTYKPSSMNCIRCMYYQIIGADIAEPDSSFISVGICNSGTDIHVRIQTAVDQMKQNGFDCEYIDVAEFIQSRQLQDIQVVSKVGVETKLRHTKYNMSFMCDGIIRYKGQYYILELKTETNSKFFARKSVDEGHMRQATAYSIAFGLSGVLFIYINRDILDMKAFLFTVTDDMKSDLIGLIETCDNYVKKLVPPPKPATVTRKMCEYCGYKERCAQDG